MEVQHVTATNIKSKRLDAERCKFEDTGPR